MDPPPGDDRPSKRSRTVDQPMKTIDSFFDQNFNDLVDQPTILYMAFAWNNDEKVDPIGLLRGTLSNHLPAQLVKDLTIACRRSGDNLVEVFQIGTTVPTRRNIEQILLEGKLGASWRLGNPEHCGPYFESKYFKQFHPISDTDVAVVIKRLIVLPTLKEWIIAMTAHLKQDDPIITDLANLIIAARIKQEYRDTMLWLNPILYKKVKFFPGLVLNGVWYSIGLLKKLRCGAVNPDRQYEIEVNLPHPMDSSDLVIWTLNSIDDGAHQKLFFPESINRVCVTTKDGAKSTEMAGKFTVAMRSQAAQQKLLDNYPVARRGDFKGFFVQKVCLFPFAKLKSLDVFRQTPTALIGPHTTTNNMCTTNKLLSLTSCPLCTPKNKKTNSFYELEYQKLNTSFCFNYTSHQQVTVQHRHSHFGTKTLKEEEIPTKPKNNPSPNILRHIILNSNMNLNNNLHFISLCIKLLYRSKLSRLIPSYITQYIRIQKRLIRLCQNAHLIILLLLIPPTEAITIGTINVGKPLLNNFEDLANYIKQHDLDILCLQETHLTSDKKGALKKSCQKNLPTYNIISLGKSRKKTQEIYQQKKIANLHNKLQGSTPDSLHQYVNKTRAKNNGGLAVLYKKELENKITNWTLDESDFRTISFTLKQTNRIRRIVNVYGPATGDKENDPFFERLTKTLEQDLVKSTNSTNTQLLILGDMNAKIDPKKDKKNQTNSETNHYMGFKSMISKLGLIGVWRVQNPTTREYTYRKNWHQNDSQETRIDYVLSTEMNDNAKATIQKFSADLSKDHNMIIFQDDVKEINDEAECPADFQPKKRRRLATAGLSKKMISENLARQDQTVKARWQTFSSNQTSTLAQDFYTSWIEDLSERAETAFPPKKEFKEKENNEYVADPELAELKKMRNSLIKTFKSPNNCHRSGVEKIKTKICERTKLRFKEDLENCLMSVPKRKDLLKAITSRIEYKKRKFNRDYISKCITRIREFGGDLKKLCSYVKRTLASRVALTQVLTKDSTGNVKTLSKAWNIIKAFDAFWPNLYKSKKQPSDWNPLKRFPLDDLGLKCNATVKEWTLTREDLNNALKRIAKNKAPGKSLIGTEILAALSEEELNQLFLFFKFCWSESFIPSEWKHSQIVLLPKSDDGSNVANYRPIALQESVYKLYAMIFLEKAWNHTESNNIIEPLQFGAIKNVALSQALFTFQSALEDANHFNKELQVLYIDFTKAFDSVENWILIKILDFYHFPDLFKKMITEMYTDNTIEIYTPLGSSGENFKINRGIKQGCVLSPLLFSLYMNPLLTALKDSKLGYKFTNNNNICIPSVQFVDDLTLIASNEQSLKELLKIVEKFCIETGMTINTKKTTYTNNRKPSTIDFNVAAIETGNPKQLDSIPGDEHVRLLGIHYNLYQDFTHQENLSISNLELDLTQIRDKCFTLKQKCLIINQMIIPKISARMNTIIYSEASRKKMNNMIKQVITQTLRLRSNSIGETFWRDYNDLGLNITSLNDENISAFLASIVHHGINPEKEFPQKALRQRLTDCAIDTNTIMKPQHGYLFGDQTRLASDLEYCLKRVSQLFEGLDLDWEKSRKPEIASIKNLKYEDKTFDMWSCENESFVPIFTDGSVREQKAGSAVFFNDSSPANWSKVTSGKQTSINAELQAYEIALSRTPVDVGMKTKIFTDCESAINLAKSTRPYSSQYKCQNRGSVARIQENLVFRKENLKQEIEFVWVPSHSLEKDVSSQKKKEQLDHLKEKYGEETYNIITQRNQKVDKLAKDAAAPRVIPGLTIVIPPRSPITPKGLPRANFIEQSTGEAFQGDVRREIKKMFKTQHRNKKLEKSNFPNHHLFESHITGRILKSNDPKLDKIQKFIMQASNNQVRNPMQLFNTTVEAQEKAPKVVEPMEEYKEEDIKHLTVKELKGLLTKHGLKKSGVKKDLIDRLIDPPPPKQQKKKPRTFTNLRAKLIHHTPICLEEECQESPVYADFLHIFQHPAAQAKLQILEDQIQALIPKSAKRLFGNFKPYWIKKEDGNLPTNKLQNIQIPVLEQEDLIPCQNLKLVTLEHMTERKISESRWRSHTKENLKRLDDKELSYRIRGTMGYFPKSAMDYLEKVTKNKKDAVTLAVDILRTQLETFVQIRTDFWKKRFDILKVNVTLHKLKYYGHKSGT